MIVVGYNEMSQGHQFTRPLGFELWGVSYLVAGKVIREVHCEQVILHSGCLSLIPPNTAYHAEIIEQVREYNILFSSRPDWDWLLRWSKKQGAIMELVLHASDERTAIEATIQDLQERQTMDPRWCELYRWNSLERILLLAATVCKESEYDDRIGRAQTFARAHLGEPLTVPMLAGVAGMSVSHFAHMFRTSHGSTPMRFVEICRMRQAQSLLLHSNMQVQEIARAVGYPSAGHFGVVFRRFAGVSPRVYRRKGVREGKSL